MFVGRPNDFKDPDQVNLADHQQGCGFRVSGAAPVGPARPGLEAGWIQRDKRKGNAGGPPQRRGAARTPGRQGPELLCRQGHGRIQPQARRRPRGSQPGETLMGDRTKIEWAQASYNPWMGCAKVSEGCRNCYAQRDMKRFGRDFGTPTRSKTTFEDPLKGKEPRRIFVCSWSDFFLETVPPDWRGGGRGGTRPAPPHTHPLVTQPPPNNAARAAET